VCTVDVSSVDESLARAAAPGGSLALPKMPIPGVGWLAYAKDTEGNIFGMMQMDPTVKRAKSHGAFPVALPFGGMNRHYPAPARCTTDSSGLEEKRFMTTKRTGTRTKAARAVKSK